MKMLILVQCVKRGVKLNMKKFVGSLLALFAIGATFASCDYAETSYRDYLNASMKVKKSDGVTPASNLALTFYDWIINYKDGSAVRERFEDPSFVTDASGAYSFKSAELRLQSGYEAESCQTVCVEEETTWEEQCDYYEDECVEWDDYGNCLYTDSFCQSYSWYPVTYCTAWGEDCEYYYPSRDVADISQAYSEITYQNVGGLEVVASPTDWTPATAYASTTTAVEGTNDKVVTMEWTQDDTFVTGLAVDAARSTNGKIAKSKLLRKRAIRPAVRVFKSSELATLTPKQRAKLEATRALWGAQKK